jgi:hypothetical protein
MGPSSEREVLTQVGESFIERAERLAKMNQVDAGLDLLYDSVDYLLKAGRFRDLDRIISQSRAEDLSLDILLGVLTATLPARSRLAARARFLEQVRSILSSRGEHDDALLCGL